jgi:hypothetical protein
MKNLEEIVERIKNNEEFQLSSLFTKAWTIGGLISVAAIDLFFWRAKSNIEFDAFVLILILIVLNSLAFLRFAFSCDAYLKGRTLKLKKLFRKVVEIDVNSIEKVDNVDLGSNKGAFIKFSHEYSTKRALIFTNKSLLLGEEVSAAEILQAAKELK